MITWDYFVHCTEVAHRLKYNIVFRVRDSQSLSGEKEIIFFNLAAALHLLHEQFVALFGAAKSLGVTKAIENNGLSKCSGAVDTLCPKGHSNNIAQSLYDFKHSHKCWWKHSCDVLIFNWADNTDAGVMIHRWLEQAECVLQVQSACYVKHAEWLSIDSNQTDSDIRRPQ